MHQFTPAAPGQLKILVLIALMTLPCLVSALPTQRQSANHFNYPDSTDSHDGRSSVKVSFLCVPLLVLILFDTEAELGFNLRALLGKERISTQH